MLSVHTRRLSVLFVGALAFAGIFLGPAVESARADVIQNINVLGKATVAFAGQTYPIGMIPGGWTWNDYFGDLADPGTIPPFVHIFMGSLSISASGEWGHDPRFLSGPEGRGYKDPAGTLPQYEAFGISIIDNIDLNTLLGVFTDNAGPIPGGAPARLIGGVSDMTTPLLNQTFAIGAGLSDVVVPFGATRLYFGLHNGYEWTNNVGSVDVVVTQVPEPSSLLLLGAGLIGLVGLRRKFKK